VSKAALKSKRTSRRVYHSGLLEEPSQLNETDDRMTDELEVGHYQSYAGKADTPLPSQLIWRPLAD